MRASFRWLRELVPDLPDRPEEVAERLGAAGHAVDAIEHLGRHKGEVVVAGIISRQPHPTRSTWSLVTLDVGQGRTKAVVCGASNVPDVGGRVVLAMPGALLPRSSQLLTVKEMDGYPSEGMILSEAELGLAESSTGIWVLGDQTSVPGTPVTTAFPELLDTVYEIDVTPNRPDALGHLGLARDLATVYDVPYSISLGALAETNALEGVRPPGRMAMATDPRLEVNYPGLISIHNLAPERCPRYGGAVVADVRIGPSPDVMRWRLHRLGIRPISNVVDVTNWLLLLYGHPMHAFDLDRVRGGRIEIRAAVAGEVMATLDGIERKLVADDLVIADAEGATALAGVMGGALSEIHAGTHRVFLECAYFEPRGIRRTARRQQIHTESSHRFERGVDPYAVEGVLELAKILLVRLAGGNPVAGLLVAETKAPQPSTIRLRRQRVEALLGCPSDWDTTRGQLERLGFAVQVFGPDEVVVATASHRPDVTLEADLIDEVARIQGLDRIPTVLPRMVSQAPSRVGQLERELRGQAVSLGLSEALLFGFVGQESLGRIGAPPPVVVLENPLSEDKNVLRTSLLPGLLDAVARARRHGEPTARLFAVGSVFLGDGVQHDVDASPTRPRAIADQKLLPVECPWFAAVLAGPRPEYLKRPTLVDFHDAKGLALELVERMTGRSAEILAFTDSTAPKCLHPRASAQIHVEGRLLGHLGTLHPNLVEALDLRDAPQIVEIDITVLERLGRNLPRYRPLPKLPAIVRDLSLEVPDSVPAGEILSLLRDAAGDLCESVQLFDLFRGGSLPPDRRALAFRIVYRDPKARLAPEEARSLTDVEVDQRQEQVLRVVSERFGAMLRS